MSALVTERHLAEAKEIARSLWGDCPRCTNHPTRKCDECERCNGTGLDECAEADAVTVELYVVQQNIGDKREPIWSTEPGFYWDAYSAGEKIAEINAVQEYHGEEKPVTSIVRLLGEVVE